MLATTADVLNVTLPDGAGEDSFSILPVLLGDPSASSVRTVTFIQGDTQDNAIAEVSMISMFACNF